VTKLREFLIVGTSVGVISAAASFLGQGATVLGGVTGGFLGTAIIIKQQDDREIRLRLLETTQIKKEELTQLETELPRLKTEVTELKTTRDQLYQVEGQLIQKQQELSEIKEQLELLKKQEQDLIKRIMVINQKKPDLSQLEQLQTTIEDFKLNKSALEGQITGLKTQIQPLEELKKNLVSLEAEYSTKNSQYQQLIQAIAKAEQQQQELQQKTAQLELLRVTYDGLFSEKQEFEQRIKELRPEIERLEGEKQRLIIAIQDNLKEYENIEQLRKKLTDIRIEIRDQQAQFRELNREIGNLESIKLGLEGQNNALLQEKEKLQKEISQLEHDKTEIKGEIDYFESNSDIALKALKTPLWTDFPTPKWTIGNSLDDEKQFLDGLINYLSSKGLAFPNRVVNAFHTSLKVQDISALVILAGISGTGKSELPQQYAQYIGAQKLTLAVQPRWDSPQDLQGFYNYVEKKFKPTELMQGLWQYNHDSKLKDRIIIVLLDEMNLARVEYYFSEFLSKLETRRSHPTYLEIEVGSLPLKPKERQLEIPRQFLFVGTMNEDETTQTLSDKVLDRANVLTFGKPNQLKLREENQQQNSSVRPHGYLAYSDFEAWLRTPDPESEIVKKIKQYLDQVNSVMEKMGHPFAHRVYQAITKYVVNYPGVTEVNSPAFQAAMGDQFGQKLLPKLRGLAMDDYQEEFDKFKEIVESLKDYALIEAWEKAEISSQRTGQFQWKGLVYPEE
jgi:predicted  nucleic acid-binding Zn-ribbon protein